MVARRTHLCGGARLAGRRRRARERVRGMSEVAKPPSESAGEGVAKWCPAVARSSRSHTHHARTRANRPGRVWPSSVRRSRGRRVNHELTSCVCERIDWGGCDQLVPGCRRSSRSHNHRTRTSANRPGRVWVNRRPNAGSYLRARVPTAMRAHGDWDDVTATEKPWSQQRSRDCNREAETATEKPWL